MNFSTFHSLGATIISLFTQSKSPIKSDATESDEQVSNLHKSKNQQADLQVSDVHKLNDQSLNVQPVWHDSNIQMDDVQNSAIQLSDLQKENDNLATRVARNPGVQILSVRSLIDQEENPTPQETVSIIHGRKSISPNMRKEVLNRDKYCQFKDPKTGKICGNARFPQVDHIQSIWAGGTNNPLNLQQLCAKHNQYKYRKEAGYSH